MSGPGARLERVGTIFSRVQGLLRSGALKESDKPIWYDVYKAFPPRGLPNNPEIPQPRKILYLDDLVRAQFYKTFGNIEPLNLNDEQSTHISQRFLDKYWVLQKQNPTKRLIDIFQATTEALKMEGITLKTFEEIKQEKQEQRAEEEQAAKTDASAVSAAVASIAQHPWQLSEAEDTMEPVDDKKQR